MSQAAAWRLLQLDRARRLWAGDYSPLLVQESLGGSIRGQGKPVPREITTFSHDRGVEATPLQTYLMSLKKRAAGEEIFGPRTHNTRFFNTDL